MHTLIRGDYSYVVYGQKPQQSGQQLQDDRIFGSNTAEPTLAEHRKDEVMIGSSSAQEPPHLQEEDRFDSNSLQQPQTQPQMQRNETLLGSNTAQLLQEQERKAPSSSGDAMQPQSQHQQDQDMIYEAPHRPEGGLSYPVDVQPPLKPEHKEPFSPSKVEQAQPQHQQDVDISDTSSAQDPPHQQGESFLDSNSVQQNQAQRDESLLSVNAMKQSQQHLPVGFSSSSEGQRPPLAQRNEDAGVSGSIKPRHAPAPQLEAKNVSGAGDGQRLRAEQQQNERPVGPNEAAPIQRQPQQSTEKSHDMSTTSD